ncbi:hypothetical protein BsIDN1_30650 [Bacillus safensis]|uniref:Ribosome maturation factor RimP N-terminal domain-containing protein n=1 Tax=Bacillus safensis TaxID=561879 RepID=A0A5S9M7I8_BACIA|nr:hypothetical protein BsIDN1_30650 [Bacillus safensis]
MDVVSEMVQPILDGLQLELVDVEFVKEGQNWFLRVLLTLIKVSISKSVPK